MNDNSALTLTYSNGQWTDQHGRKVVNPDEANKVVIFPARFRGGEDGTFQWPGTYEVIEQHVGNPMGDTSYPTFEQVIKLIPPVNSAHGYTEGSEVPFTPEEREQIRLFNEIGGAATGYDSFAFYERHVRNLMSRYEIKIRVSDNSARINWPTEEERMSQCANTNPYNYRIDDEMYDHSTWEGGFVAAIEWLSSRLQPQTDTEMEKCPYCGPDGTQWNGDSSRICPHCDGKGYIFSDNSAHKWMMEVERLKSELLHRDVSVLPEKDAELYRKDAEVTRLKAENEQLKAKLSEYEKV